MGKLFDELRRRNVIRVSVAYIVAAWVLLQVADLVLDNIGAPEWVMQAFMLALALGFPVVVLFSWAFELTPEGIKRESEVERSASVTHLTAQKLDRMTIGLLIVVLALFGYEQFAGRGEPVATDATASTTGSDEKSIAVLAFADLSAEGNQEYFAEGISEELLNVLAQIPDLKVAGRTSSFAFKDQNRDLREIGEILEVAHILEGSVRTAGNRVRVTAQLIKADDGFHLFSKTYDRELNDIFEVQDDIAREIGTALRSAILGESSQEIATPTSLETYNKYLRARQWIHTRDRGLMEQASTLLDEALAEDPEYAPALAQKALVLLLLSDSGGAYGDIPLAEAAAAARPLLDRAIELDPGLAEAHAVLGLLHAQTEVSYSEDAVASLKRALAINPSMANANNWLASEISVSANVGESRTLYEKVVEHDPLYGPAFNNLMFQYMQTRALDKADSLVRRVQRITGDSPSVHFARGSLAFASGDLSTAISELAEAYSFNPNASVVQLWYGTAAYFIGDHDLTVEVSRPTDRLVSLEMLGRHDEAAEIVASLDGTPLEEGQLRGISDWYLVRKRGAEFVEFAERQFSGEPDWIDSYPLPNELWGTGAHANLVVSLRAAGREADAGRALAIALESAQTQLESGADNLFFWYGHAELGALAGDRQRVLGGIRNAIDTGFVSVFGFNSPPFDPYRDDARFIALETEMIRRANDERRELGLLAL